MALQLSGPISIGNINVELGRSSSTVNTSINEAQNGFYGTIRQASTYKPLPNDQASLSEWYGYEHIANNPSCNIATLTVGNAGAVYGYISGGLFGSMSSTNASIAYSGATFFNIRYDTDIELLKLSFNSSSNTIPPTNWTTLKIGAITYLRTDFSALTFDGAYWYCSKSMAPLNSPIGTTIGAVLDIELCNSTVLTYNQYTFQGDYDGYSLGTTMTCESHSGFNINIYSYDNTITIGSVIYTDTTLKTPLIGNNLTHYCVTNSSLITINNYGSVTAISVCSLDTTPPTTPVLSIPGNFGSYIALNWTTSTDASGIAYYEVWRDINNSSIYSVATIVEITSYNDIDVIGGNTYSYKIKAVDNNNNVSAFSNTRSVFY